MIKILLLICALWVTPFAVADESVMVTAVQKPAFYYTICLPAMANQERLYNVTGEDHAVTDSERPNNDGWEGFNRAEVPFEIGWSI